MTPIHPGSSNVLTQNSQVHVLARNVAVICDDATFVAAGIVFRHVRQSDLIVTENCGAWHGRVQTVPFDLKWELSGIDFLGLEMVYIEEEYILCEKGACDKNGSLTLMSGFRRSVGVRQSSSTVSPSFTSLVVPGRVTTEFVSLSEIGKGSGLI